MTGKEKALAARSVKEDLGACRGVSSGALEVVGTESSPNPVRLRLLQVCI